VFVGGVMLGCHALDRDAPLRVAHLFEGFQGAHFVPLLIIGVANIAITFGIVVIAAGSVFGGMHLSNSRMDTGGDPLAHMGARWARIGPQLAGLLGLVIPR
jgi:hypothetical protein